MAYPSSIGQTLYPIQQTNWQLSGTVPSNGTGYYGTPPSFEPYATGYTSTATNAPSVGNYLNEISAMGQTTLSPNHINWTTNTPYVSNTPTLTAQSSRGADWFNNAKQAINNNPTVQQAKANISQASLWDKTNATLGAIGSVMNVYNAYKANKLANKQFAHAVDVHNKNWDAQRKQTNSQLEDRQKRRVEEAAANGRTTTSVADYMAKYGV